LLFQIRVRLRAEKAGLASVTIESDQLVLRFPALPEGTSSRNLPKINSDARPGRNAYWLPFASRPENWRELLMESLTLVSEKCQQS